MLGSQQIWTNALEAMAVHRQSGRFFCCLVAGLVIAGCQPDSPREDNTAVTPRAPGAVGLISGEAYYLERIAAPPGASLQLRLLNLQRSDLARAVVAELSIPGGGNPPYQFELAYDPSRITDGEDYGLEAALLGADGRTLFATELAVPVTFQAPEAVSLRLVQTTDPPPRDELATAARGQAYQCGDLRLEAQFIEAGTLLLTLPDRDIRLPAAVSASGARFSNGRDEFWTKGEDSALLSLAGGESVACRVIVLK